MISSFQEFLNESSKCEIQWEKMDFRSYNEKEVADIAEESLFTKNLVVFLKGCPQYVKLEQHASSEEGEKVLEVTGNDLTLFTTPFDFLKWDREIDDPAYIMKTEDTDKI